MSALNQYAQAAHSHSARAAALVDAPDAIDTPTRALVHALLAVDSRLAMLVELVADLGSSQHPIFTEQRRPVR